jgi:protein-disulfide isomerase
MNPAPTSASSSAPPRNGVFFFALFLALVGLTGSVYLADLDVRVLRAGGAAVSSFCTISEGLDCVAVAASKYALFLGVPVAFYGVEFFVAMLALLLLSRLPRWPLRRWDSYLAWFAALSVPVIVVLGYISVGLIGSLCLVCLTVHGANLLLLATLLVANRARLAELALAGPRELLAVLRSQRAAQVAGAALAVAALSQFFWMPRLLPAGVKMERGLWNGLTSAGLTLGPADAPLRIEVFTDYQCPFCDKANDALLSVAAKHPNAVYIRHRDFPLDMACNPTLDRPFHPNACEAARYARCAAAQNRFWAMDELLFLNQATLAEPDLRRLAAEAGLDPVRLDRCLADPATLRAIQVDIREGAKRGVEGTPAFFVNGEMVVGFKPAAYWEQRIGGSPTP